MPKKPLGGKVSFNSGNNHNNSFSKPRTSASGGFGGFNLGNGLLNSIGAAVGTAVGSAVGQAIQPAVNNVGQSVANNINAKSQATISNAQTQRMNAETQRIIANKKETKSYEFFDECPYCGAPREGNNHECEYCGTSLIKNTETKIE